MSKTHRIATEDYLLFIFQLPDSMLCTQLSILAVHTVK